MSNTRPKRQEPHHISIAHERSEYMPHGGTRACCTCGWASDCYAQHGDTQRAVDVHLRRARDIDIDKTGLT